MYYIKELCVKLVIYQKLTLSLVSKFNWLNNSNTSSEATSCRHALLSIYVSNSVTLYNLQKLSLIIWRLSPGNVTLLMALNYHQDYCGCYGQTLYLINMITRPRRLEAKTCRLNDCHNCLHQTDVYSTNSTPIYAVSINIHKHNQLGVGGAEVLRYKSKGRGFDWSFSLTYFFRPHYGPGVDSASKRNDYQEYFQGVKAAGA
jgi:hypothetical protein